MLRVLEGGDGGFEVGAVGVGGAGVFVGADGAADGGLGEGCGEGYLGLLAAVVHGSTGRAYRFNDSSGYWVVGRTILYGSSAKTEAVDWIRLILFEVLGFGSAGDWGNGHGEELW
jgi:hypothetical protein